MANIDFDTAKIQLETEFFGSFHFFWKSKTGTEKFEAKEQLIETDLWFFGYGHRHQFGLLEEELKAKYIFPNF